MGWNGCWAEAGVEAARTCDLGPACRGSCPGIVICHMCMYWCMLYIDGGGGTYVWLYVVTIT